MEIVERGIIVDAEELRGDKRSHCFTSLCRVPGGRVLATFRRGSDKESADGNCLVASSVDGGRHWQIMSDSFRPGFTGVPGEVRSAEIIPLSDGSLLAFLTWLHRSGGRPLYDSGGDHVAPCRIIQARSTDGGATWSRYEVLDTSPWNYPVLAGSPIRVPGRGWMVPFERQEPEEEGGRASTRPMPCWPRRKEASTKSSTWPEIRRTDFSSTTSAKRSARGRDVRWPPSGPTTACRGGIWKSICLGGTRRL